MQLDPVLSLTQTPAKNENKPEKYQDPLNSVNSKANS